MIVFTGIAERPADERPRNREPKFAERRKARCSSLQFRTSRKITVKRPFSVSILLITFLLAPSAAFSEEEADRYWPQWRGPRGTGVAPLAKPPLFWREDDNVRWKVELPGRGHSTPVVWDNHLFVTAAVPIGEQLAPKYSGAPGAHDNLPVTQRHEFIVMAINRRDGTTRWQRAVREALPHEGAHHSASLASASPVTDGKHVFAFFGSYGIYCFDFDGELVWKKDFGRMNTKHGHGEGSSPVLFDDTLVVNWDHEGQSFVVAIDKQSGKERWRKARNELTSWATPLVVIDGDKPQVIVPGTTRVRAYDLANGEVIWKCGGLTANIVATPVAGNGVVYVGSSYGDRAVMAIQFAGAKGDITGSARVVWNRFRGAPYVPSPLLYGKSLYFLSHYQGILTRVEASTGEDRPGAMRLKGIRDVYGSPVGADDRVYVAGRDGTTVVVQHGDLERILATNKLDDRFNATPVPVGSELILRGEQHLYCIAED
jgi:outer membrane protein assembly factor BamB